MRFICILLGLILTTLAQANMRAPVSTREPPGSVLTGSNGLTVLHENLRVECNDACVVVAMYSVAAASDGDYQFTFVTPDPAQLAVKVNQTPVDVAHGPLAVDQARRIGEINARARARPPAQARFETALRAGHNEIQVSYRQAHGLQEHGHSYFSKGRFVRHFRYELWPLKEWARAPDFTLDLVVLLPSEPPGYFARRSGRYPVIVCGADENSTLPQARTIRSDTQLEYHVRFSEFPDHLFCRIGDADLLGR